MAAVLLLATVAGTAGVAIQHLRESGAPPVIASPSPKPKGERLPPVPLIAGERSAIIMSVRQFRTEVEEKRGLVLDARPAVEYRQGHVPGALSLPAEDFDTHYASLKSRMEGNKGQPITLYCSSFYCKMSGEVQTKLRELGYSRISIFINGWSAWQQAGLPEEKSE